MLEVPRESWRLIFPNAPSAVIDAFTAKADVFAKAGITASRNRLAFFTSNVEHECGGFALRNLTENILYTAKRMAQVWPSRFPGGAAAVVAHFGSAPGWQLRAFDDIYGNRMGNRPGTHDGSTYIGRGGPQATGRDGYKAVGDRAGRDFETDYKSISELDLQPEVCSAFWTWKNLNHFADNNDFLGCVKIWNGGTNGLADRKALMSGNNPIIARLGNVQNHIDVINEIEAPSIAPAQDPLPQTKYLQIGLNKLAAAGYIRIPAPLETATGIYGNKTHDAVEAFQKRFNVPPIDGVAGTLTMAALKKQLELHALR